MSLTERRFRAMGSEMRVLVGEPVGDQPAAAAAAASVEADLVEFDRRLSRFRPDSELCELNRDPRDVVPASALLRAAVRAGLWAAELSGGLVDPTLLPQLEQAGYRVSREELDGVPLAEALAAAPPRRPAAPRAEAEWRSIQIDDERGEVRRPPGVMFDTGGTGKGLAADRVARRLARYIRYAIDCGGDIRVGGLLSASSPLEIEVQHPLSGECVDTLRIRAGAIATSGLDVNVWRLPDGAYAHHLIDPMSGRPAWTGLVGATARASTAVEAEALSKAAILGGAGQARTFLASHGGLIVHEDGDVERIGPLHDPPRLEARLPG